MDTLSDKVLINEIKKKADNFKKKLENEIITYIERDGFDVSKIAHPLDNDVMADLNEFFKILENNPTDNNLQYRNVEELDDFWKKVLQKALKCLLFFDKSRPFRSTPGKTIATYGINKLIEYYEDNKSFEALLYGSNQNYRDHVFHVFRTWLIGVYAMLEYDGFKIDNIDGTNEKWDDISQNLTECEKLSMWTIIALCHDLGYPLEKSNEIVGLTQKMIAKIIIDPKISVDLSFGSTQTLINERFLKFISNKLITTKLFKTSQMNGKTDIKKGKYCNQEQTKYYNKFLESLGKNKHGIISSIILYNTLQYFKESEYNTNNNYEYDTEAAHRFYIQREILRAIAAHTCSDIYNVKINTFSSFLYICDEMQNWGRKNWHEFYTGTKTNEPEVDIVEFGESKIFYKETITLDKDYDIEEFVFEIFHNQYQNYKEKFRDGQHSELRKFDIINQIEVIQGTNDAHRPKAKITISIMGNNQNDSFKVKYENISEKEKINKDNEHIKNSMFWEEFSVE